MSSRPVGMGAFTNRTSLTTSYATHGAALRSSQAETLKTQLSVFQSLVHSFALQHGDKIRKDPAFRAEWARMCKAIGVDPLAGSSSSLALASKSSSSSAADSSTKSKGWLAALSLGREVETFYHRLAVRVVEACVATRGENGGLLAVSECRRAIVAAEQRASAAIVGSDGGNTGLSMMSAVSDADVERAVESLAPLGAGYSLATLGGRRMVRSVPRQLSTDQSRVLEALHLLGGCVSVGLLRLNLGWERARCETALGDLLAGSLVWVDLKAPVEPEYWSPAFLAGSGN